MDESLVTVLRDIERELLKANLVYEPVSGSPNKSICRISRGSKADLDKRFAVIMEYQNDLRVANILNMWNDFQSFMTTPSKTSADKTASASKVPIIVFMVCFILALVGMLADLWYFIVLGFLGGFLGVPISMAGQFIHVFKSVSSEPTRSAFEEEIEQRRGILAMECAKLADELEQEQRWS